MDRKRNIFFTSIRIMSYQKSSKSDEMQSATEDCRSSNIPTDEEPSKHHNAKEKFVHILYNDFVDILLTKKRNRTEFQKSGFSKDSIKDDPLLEADTSEVVEMEFSNKNNYVGHLIGKRMEGEGVYRWSSGETYKESIGGGKLEKNSIEGRGNLRWNDDSWYEGEFHKGYRCGNGNLVSREYRRFYIGEWHMGRKHGNGYSRYHNNDDDFYEGDWNMDQKHGSGYRVYENGARYIGQWVDDQRHGFGTMVWPNGDLYRGEWEHGTMNGYGEYVWNSFLNESLSWPQENCYMGEWLDGMRHGNGVLELNTLGGAKYSGNWYLDKKHGHGMIIGNSGAVTEADPLFLEDILVPLQSNDSTHLQNTESESRNKTGKESPNSAAGKAGNHSKQRKPRRTTVFDPLDSVPVSFHVQRLLDQWDSIYNIDQSSVGDISSGKCRMCGDQSSCACLYDPSRIPESKSTTLAYFDIASSSSEYCTENPDGLVNVKEQSEKQYEEHWVRSCLMIHMQKLRQVYKTYAELYCNDKENPIQRNLSMGKIALWQLMRDCGLNTRGISLIQFQRYIAMNKSAFIEAPFYPFERIAFFQFVHSLLEVSWHLYTKLGDIETGEIRGRLAGGLHRLLVTDIFPNAGKTVGNVSTCTYRDLLPLYPVYQLYGDVGEPHTAKQFLRASCIVKGSADPKPLPWPMTETKPISPHLLNGINAITVGDKLSFIRAEGPTMEYRSSEMTKTVYEDELARELFAFRHLGASKMVSIMATVCPGIKDQKTETIVNMDYELTFLEFFEILLEAARTLIDTRKTIEEEARRASEIAEAELAKAEAELLSRSQSLQSSQTQSKRSTTTKVSKSRKKLA